MTVKRDKYGDVKQLLRFLSIAAYVNLTFSIQLSYSFPHTYLTSFENENNIRETSSPDRLIFRIWT